MGGCLDLHADPRRGLSPAEYACETSVHWNGPSMAECDSLLECCLNMYFGEGKPWHFVSLDEKDRALKYVVSKVVDRLNKEPSKISFMK